jgi:uncharacterized damage-inducible protein DinB
MQIDKSEYHPYYDSYVNKVPEGNIVATLRLQTAKVLALYQSLSDDQWSSTYAPGKWTIKELLVHLLDSERIFAYRALRIARGDQTPLPGFEQDDYIVTSQANERAAADLLEEYQALRSSTICLLQNFTPAMLARTGTASGSNISVRALCAIITGHELHHFQIIQERYLS